jgi:hypothetical protein
VWGTGSGALQVHVRLAYSPERGVWEILDGAEGISFAVGDDGFEFEVPVDALGGTGAVGLIRADVQDCGEECRILDESDDCGAVSRL